MSRIDVAKLVRWFDAHSAALVLYARQWLDRAAAEDAVQEAFMRLIAQRSEPKNPRAWLFVTVRNAAISAGRSTRRREHHEKAAAQQQLPVFVAASDDRIDAVAAEAALADLPPVRREIVVMRIWGAMKLAEIAEVVGQPVSSVHDHYQSALQRLRERMKVAETPCPK